MVSISIIIPVYKVEKYIHRCINSILAQSYKDYEVILVDDGSPDRCPQICDDYAKQDERIKVIHKNNGGLSSARNVGLDAARGHYILFCDSDDCIHPKMLEVLHSLCQRYNADIAMGLIERFNTIIPEYREIDVENKRLLSGVEIQECFFDRLNSYQYISACGKMFRRELFQQARFPVGKLFEDEYLTYQVMLNANTICEIKTPVYYYLENPEGITKNISPVQWMDDYQARYEKCLYFREMGYIKLYHKSIMDYLERGQWILIEYRNNDKLIDLYRIHLKRYQEILEMAKMEQLVHMPEHFDYFMLANPEKGLLIRMWKKLLDIFGKLS